MKMANGYVYFATMKNNRKKLKTVSQPGIVVDACNPSIQEPVAGDHEFEASLSYILRSYLKNQANQNKTSQIRAPGSTSAQAEHTTRLGHHVLTCASNQSTSLLPGSTDL
jgi:hypothetical protein